jgi:zinc protease
MRWLAAAATAVAVLAGVPAAAQENSPRWKAWPGSRMPKPLDARQVPFPPYELRTLANGLRVVAVPHHEQPAVTVRLLVRAGAAQDPAGRPGVATLLAAVLDQGTSTRTASEIADAIDYVGGALGTGAGMDLSFVNAVVTRDDFDLALDLVADVARRPALDPEEIARQREQLLSAQQVSAQDPEFLADAVLERLVFGYHPYGVPSGGTPQSVAAITREDLAAFHGTWFVPNNAILAVVGDLTTAEAFAGAERAFGSWARKDVPAGTFPEPPPATRRVVLVDRPGAVQTEIRVGNVAIPRNHRDYMALDLAIRILGGEGSNRLQRVLRSERGLTYGASVEASGLLESGLVVGETDTRSDKTGETLRLTVDEFWRLQREPVSEWELSSVQAYIAGNFPIGIETPNAIAQQILSALHYGIDLKELQEFRDRVNGVTVDDIQRVARLYLKPGRLSIALVGDAGLVADQLRRVGFNEFEVIGIDRLDLTAADFKRATPPPAAAPR